MLSSSSRSLPCVFSLYIYNTPIYTNSSLAAHTNNNNHARNRITCLGSQAPLASPTFRTRASTSDIRLRSRSGTRTSPRSLDIPPLRKPTSSESLGSRLLYHDRYSILSSIFVCLTCDRPRLVSPFPTLRCRYISPPSPRSQSTSAASATLPKTIGDPRNKTGLWLFLRFNLAPTTPLLYLSAL